MATEYSPEVKAAVMQALAEGQAISYVAAQYDIPAGTIRSWRSRMNGAPVAVVADQKKARIGDLLIEYVEESLASLKKQTEHFSDKTWLAQQDASALAMLHGVQTDKIIRLLEALARAESRSETAKN